MDVAERKERGGELLKKMLGTEQAEEVRSAWREISPEFEEYVVEFLAGEIWSRKQLDLRTKSLVTIAALAALGRTRALELNIRIAAFFAFGHVHMPAMLANHARSVMGSPILDGLKGHGGHQFVSRRLIQR